MKATLSTILNEIRINNSFYARSELYGSWGFENPASNGAIFHYVVEGEFELKTLEGEIYKFKQGDLVLTVNGKGHFLQSHDGVQIKQLEELSLTKDGTNILQVKSGSSGKKTVLICGGMSLNPSWHPLFQALPTFIYLKREEQVCTAWLDKLIELMNIEVELGLSGSEAIITRLCEVLVIETIRKWIDKKDENLGWALALQDKNIGNALVKMHTNPEISWTVEDLARQADMSRTSFSEHFSKKVGSSPISYLNFLRMNLAADDLKSGIKTITEIANTVGYDSVVSFNRAFKKFWGKPPGEFRVLPSNVL